MKVKKFLSFLLVLTMLLSCFPTLAAAATVTQSGECGAQGNNLRWELDSEGTLTISGTGDMKDYSYSGVPWESYRVDIKKIVIENGVTSVGDCAFRLTEATSVSLPEGLTSIGDSAFEAANFTEITLPSTLNTIEYYAFVNCDALRNITIPAAVTSLHYRAFANCTSLTGINVNPANTEYCSVDGVLFNKDMTTLIKYPCAKGDRSYTVPEGVITIGYEAFHLVSFYDGITIPASVKTIEDNAFTGYQCYIKSVDYGGTEADRRKISIGTANTLLTNATWNYVEPDYAFSFTDASVTKGETATVSLVLDTDVNVLAGTVTISAADSNNNELGITLITPNSIEGCEIDYEGSKILIATEGTIAAGTKIADISFVTDDNTVAGDYTVTLVSNLYTGDMTSGENDQKVDFTVNEGTISVSEKPVTVTWKNEGGAILETDENVAYGSTPVYDGATPQKASTAQYTYTFNGWTPAVGAVTEDTVYTATYTETLRSYTLTFKNESGTTIKTLTVPYGTEPGDIEGIPEVPAKEATAEYTYIAKDWGVEKVTGEATYTASYTASKNSYTITWKDEDGSTLGTTTVEYGQTPTYAAPSKATDVGYTYSFSEWDPIPSAVTGAATYQAVYTATARSYSVSVAGIVDGATFVLKDSNGTAVEPVDGKYTLTYDQTYSYTVNAVGYKPVEKSFTVSSENSGLAFESGAGTAVLTLVAMEKFIGDMNNDGAITIGDAQALYNYILGRYELDEEGKAYEGQRLVFNLNVADINENEEVGEDDILPMLRLINASAGN